MSYPAHIREDGVIQTVSEHCIEASELAESLMCNIKLGKTAYIAGILHDMGKFSDEFRNYITKASRGERVRKGSVIHSFAGVRYLLRHHHDENSVDNDLCNLLTAEIISCAVGGHHGLFDCFDEDDRCGFTYRRDKQPEYDDKAMSVFFNEVIDEKQISTLSIHLAKSASPVDIQSMQITKSVSGEKKDGKEKGSDTMGTKHFVRFGLYTVKGSINVQLAEKTGFTEEDSKTIKECLRTLFVNDTSAARPDGSMEVVKVYWWRHNCKDGQYSSAKVHNLVRISLKEGIIQPTSVEDYNITLSSLEGLNCEEILGI